MHPILRRPSRLAAFFAGAVAAGFALGAAVRSVTPGPLPQTLLLTVPLSVILAFQCLAAWYPARSMPVDRTPPGRLIATQALYALASAGIWLALGWFWASSLSRLAIVADAPERFAAAAALLALLALLVHVLSLLGHDLWIAVEHSREIERRALEARLLARDAELRLLRAQLDPHFLFNSLNSVSSLAGSEPDSARRMCLLLAGFFRKSLGLGQRSAIPFDEELFLAETYLAIEEVRFGRRLKVRADIETEARGLAIPPLLLQPLVENAVRHGVEHLLEGGEVRLEARAAGGELVVAVENPCDPDRPASRGSGLGLANVRSRLAAEFGGDASLRIEERPERFRAELRIPASPAPRPA